MATNSTFIEVSAVVKPCADKIHRSTWIFKSFGGKRSFFLIKAALCKHNAKEMIYIIK